MPEITETISGYTFEWLKEKLVINISRLHPHKDGRLTGDVQMLLGTSKKQEPSFTFNFNSTRTRKELINSFNEKYPEWEWLPLIDEFCREVQRLSQEGEPIQELWTSQNISPPEYLLEPILLKGLPTII